MILACIKQIEAQDQGSDIRDLIRPKRRRVSSCLGLMAARPRLLVAIEASKHVIRAACTDPPWAWALGTLPCIFIRPSSSAE